MGCDVTKPVFGVSDKARLKPISSATETSLKIKFSLVACLDVILSKMGITKALISLRGCAGWSVPLLFPNHRRQFFLRRGPQRLNKGFDAKIAKVFNVVNLKKSLSTHNLAMLVCNLRLFKFLSIFF